MNLKLIRCKYFFCLNLTLVIHHLQLFNHLKLTFYSDFMLFCFSLAILSYVRKCFMLVAWSHSCSRGWVTQCSLLLCRDNLLPSLPCVYSSLPPYAECCLETVLTLPFCSPPSFHFSPLKAFLTHPSCSIILACEWGLSSTMGKLPAQILARYCAWPPF